MPDKMRSTTGRWTKSLSAEIQIICPQAWKWRGGEFLRNEFMSGLQTREKRSSNFKIFELKFKF